MFLLVHLAKIDHVSQLVTPNKVFVQLKSCHNEKIKMQSDLSTNWRGAVPSLAQAGLKLLPHSFPPLSFLAYPSLPPSGWPELIEFRKS